jgi:Uma2 family endonuclease
MSTVASTPPAANRLAIPPEPVLPFTVAQYHAMIRMAVLESGAPIELLEGWLVRKALKSPPHSVFMSETSHALAALVPGSWTVDSQQPITTDDSEPEPDVTVVRGSRRDYSDRHPGPSDVGLLVEVAVTSLERDRGWKKRIYAAAGIPVYWIVNLVDGCLEVYSQPSGADYADRQVLRPGDNVPVVLDATEVGRIAVKDLLP